MDEALSEKSLVWAIWDREGVVAAALAGLLERLLTERQILARMLRVDSPSQFPQIASLQPLALAVWVFQDESQLSESLSAIAAIRERSSESVCLCMAGSLPSDIDALLAEAGAQLVLRDVAALPPVLSRMALHAPLSNQGLHPLTTGLVARLPWGDRP